MSEEGFSVAVRKVFDSVAAQYGMECVAGDAGCVRYKNDRVGMSIGFDAQRSLELDVFIGRIGSERREFSLFEIIRANGGQGPQVIQAASSSDYAQFIPLLRTLVTEHCAALLTGDSDAFARVNRNRDREVEAYRLKGELLHARQKADGAWKIQDYGTVIRAFSKLEEFMTPAEKKRHKIAAQRLSQSGKPKG